jgi:phycocyanobilin lyase subunit beta
MSVEELIDRVDRADSSNSLIDAVRDLAAAESEAAIPKLIEALAYNNPGVAVAAVDGLIAIGQPAATPLLELLDGYNYSARAWAIRAMAGIGDPRALELLWHAACEDFALSVRRAAARGLGTIRWEDLPTEAIIPAQQRTIEVLIVASADIEWVVKYAAITGLEALAIRTISTHVELTAKILHHFDDRTPQEDSNAVLARIWLAQKRIQEAIFAILADADAAGNDVLPIDWQTTLEKLYDRKRQERPIPEGDPRKFLSYC